MSKLRNSLNKATFRYEDVTISLDGELGVERDALYKELGEVAQQPVHQMGPGPVVEVQKRIDALEDRMREDLVTLRFRAISTDRWNGIIALNPPRDNVPLDARKGYNIISTTKAAAEAGGWVVDGDKTEPVPADEWADLWDNLSGGDFDRIWGTITRLNESNGWAGVDFLKKDSTKTPASTGTSDSPEA